MNERGGVIIAGGGIGGLAAALAVSRAGWDARLFERAPAFSEVGAGVQLGPNVAKVLQAWGLASALKVVAAFPERLQVRSAQSGRLLAEMPLGNEIARRYGAPYVTVHRADLHGLLLQAVQQHTDTPLHLGQVLHSFRQGADAVSVESSGGAALEADALIGADGLWSAVRQQLLGDGPPRSTGHLAYRALMAQSALPASLRSQDVTVWLGSRMHVVRYPVRAGASLNVVAIVHGQLAEASAGWDHSANAAELATAMAGACTDLRQLMAAMVGWRLWALCDRRPMQGAQQHAAGRVALLGDAAHPMRPYLAQGAGMAIEDAAALGHALGQVNGGDVDVPRSLQRYAQARWLRNARVQARALRNGQIFHAAGPLRWGRDASLKLLGARLLDMPWLYGATPKTT